MAINGNSPSRRARDDVRPDEAILVAVNRGLGKIMDKVEERTVPDNVLPKDITRGKVPSKARWLPRLSNPLEVLPRLGLLQKPAKLVLPSRSRPRCLRPLHRPQPQLNP